MTLYRVKIISYGNLCVSSLEQGTYIGVIQSMRTDTEMLEGGQGIGFLNDASAMPLRKMNRRFVTGLV